MDGITQTITTHNHKTHKPSNLNKRTSPKASNPSSPHHQPNKAQPSINLHIEEGDPIEPEEEAEAGAVAEDLCNKTTTTSQRTQQVLLSLPRKRLRPHNQLLPQKEKKLREIGAQKNA
jgi:hypothetical protein